MLVYGIATGASALAWSLSALLVLRFVVGLGLAPSSRSPRRVVSEFAPARIRGRVVVILEAFWVVGWTPELYPTTLRGTGSGWAGGLGRIASILAPLAVPPLTGIGGNAVVFGCFALSFVLAALAALTLPELHVAALEE